MKHFIYWLMELFCLLIALHVCSQPPVAATRLKATKSLSNSFRHSRPVPFCQVVTDALNKAIARQYRDSITLIEDFSQSELVWNYQNNNGFFNQYTFDYISSRVSKGSLPCEAQFSTSGSFPNAYSQLLSTLSYCVSSSDLQKIAHITSNAITESTQIVNTYESIFGIITPSRLDSARLRYGNLITTQLDYIINVVAGAEWSGRAKAGLSSLTYTQILNAKDLNQLLIDTLPGAWMTIRDIKIYLTKIRSVTAIVDAVANGAWTLQQLKNNTRSPSIVNGGMQTFNPNDGAISPTFQVAYNIANSTASIYNDLLDADRNITIVICTGKSGENNITIYTSWKKNDIDTICYSLPDSIYIDMYPMATGSSNQLTVLRYYGFSMLSISPVYWNDTTNQGWFFDVPIRQAIVNGQQDVSGYKFISLPLPYNLSSLQQGGTFGYASKLLICREQRLDFTEGRSSTCIAAPIPVFPILEPSVPQYMQSAKVIGGYFSFPGAIK